MLVLLLVVLFPDIGAAQDVLEPYRGNRQFVLLFAKSRSDASLDRQLSLFADDRAGLEARDIVVLSTAGNRETMAVFGYASLPLGAGRELTRQFQPAPVGLTVILIGRDGSELGRWNHVVEPDTIFDLADQQESD